MELGKDFRELFELLNRHEVHYLAVGGFAVAVHGRPRYTKDLDIWVEVSPDNAARIIAPVIRKVRRDQLDEDAERLAYWRQRSPGECIVEVESLRRLRIEITGDPDQPIELVVHRRRLGDPAIQRPDGAAPGRSRAR